MPSHQERVQKAYGPEPPKRPFCANCGHWRDAHSEVHATGVQDRLVSVVLVCPTSLFREQTER